MNKFFLTAAFLVNFIFFNHASAQSYSETPQWIQDLPVAQDVEQLFVVAGTGRTTAWVSFNEKDSEGNWRQIVATSAFIGQNGLGKVREGDHKTPVGTFVIDAAFGIAPDPGCQMPYKQIDENYYWSGDWNYKYNKMVDARENPYFDTTYSEHLIEYNPYYIYCLNMGYNKECIPGKGSALFIHCSNPAKPWTGGCVALPEAQMKIVMQHVRPGCVTVIDSLQNLGGSL